MKVQTRLSLFSSIVFGVIFVVTALFAYGLYYRQAEKIIYKNLKKTSDLIALFYLEEDELNKEDFAKIREQFNEFISNSEYQLYDEQNSISFGSQSSHIKSELLDEIREKRSLIFSDDTFFCYGIYYEDNQGDFVIIAKEQRTLLNEQMNSLLWILLSCFFIGLITIVLFSKWGARRAYQPFSNIIKQVKDISTNRLDVQIQSPNTKDELQNLTDTFNELLEKISETMLIQKNFVNYVSHEFKTPLASMLGNLEVFSIKDRSPEEYRQLSENLIAQVVQLEEILNTLMVISDLRKDAESIEQTRIDELIWEIIDKITGVYPHSKIHTTIDIQPEDEPLLLVAQERTQLLMALFNLVENAVKYSKGKPVDIHIFKCENNLCLSIADKGTGIMPEHLTHIRKPFYRADHTNQVKGSGIGLSIALRIIEKNKIECKIESEVGIGTTIILKFQA
jgi:signal transduction histidine kinase